MDSTISLLVITASSTQRTAIRNSIEKSSLVTIAGEAKSVPEALKMASRHSFDMSLLDMQTLPTNDNRFLRELISKYPHPMIVLSDPTENGYLSCFTALRNGALDCIFKDVLGKGHSKKLVETIICASKLEVCPDVSLVDNIQVTQPPAKRKSEIIFCEDCGAKNIFENELNTENVQRRCQQCGDLLETIDQYKRTNYVTVIVAGAGSYPNLLKIIPRVPSGMSGAIIITISDENGHVDAFTQYLNSISAVNVYRMKNGQSIEGGNCYVTTFGSGLYMKPLSTRNTMERAPKTSKQDSVTVLMESIAAVFKNNTAALFLSGSGMNKEKGLNAITSHGGISAVLFSPNCLHRQMGEDILRKCKVNKIVDENNAHQFITELHNAARESLSTA